MTATSTTCEHTAWETDSVGTPVRCADCRRGFTVAERAARLAPTLATLKPGDEVVVTVRSYGADTLPFRFDTVSKVTATQIMLDGYGVDRFDRKTGKLRGRTDGWHTPTLRPATLEDRRRLKVHRGREALALLRLTKRPPSISDTEAIEVFDAIEALVIKLGGAL